MSAACQVMFSTTRAGYPELIPKGFELHLKDCTEKYIPSVKRFSVVRGCGGDVAVFWNGKDVAAYPMSDLWLIKEGESVLAIPERRTT